MNRECIDFARQHLDDDTAQLLLGAARYCGIDMPAAVRQIEGLRMARDKWPELLFCESFEYPPRLNREQASSWATAVFKASLHTASRPVVADLTGGMGIDTLAFARVAEHVDYVERSPELCALMERNLNALGVDNVAVHCADSIEWLSREHDVAHTLVYVDPARRDADGRKVSAFDHCEPNILKYADLLRQQGSCLMVKASPMMDIDMGCRQLGDVTEVHVVSLRGECKEVLFLCGNLQGQTQIYCNMLTDRDTVSIGFTRVDEVAAAPRLCNTLGPYIYEPDAALMKAGPFGLICRWYDVEMLGRNTHLFTSDCLVTAFPGRIFRVLRELKRADIAAAVPDGCAHVMCRNFPVPAAVLQRQLGLKEGGDCFIVATTVDRRKTLLLCERVTEVCMKKKTHPDAGCVMCN